MTFTFILVEDDPFVTEWVIRLIQKDIELRNKVEIVAVQSEREFLLRKNALLTEEVTGIIVDLMLPFENGVSGEELAHMEPRGKIFHAGLRVLKDIAAWTGARTVPVLLYTVNDRPSQDALPQGLRLEYLRKDEPDEKLVRWIKRAMLREH